MALLDTAIARMEGVITDEGIDWSKWLHPADASRIIPAESVAEKATEVMLMGHGYQSGLTLPWNVTAHNVNIRPGKLAIWTGWSHHGKTQMLKMLMLWAIKQGEKVLMASMEEEVVELWTDLAVMYCNTAEPTLKALEEFRRFVAGRLWFYDQQGVVNSERMQAVLRYAAATHGTTQAVIDSLMMLAVNRDDYEAQSRFVSELKAIAKDTAQTVHLVAHMRKREGKTGDDAPGSMHDIAGGHEIASKADYVFNVWRNKKVPGECVLTVEKQRGRPNWLGRVGLKYHEKSRQFVEGNMAISFDTPDAPG